MVEGGKYGSIGKMIAIFFHLDSDRVAEEIFLFCPILLALLKKKLMTQYETKCSSRSESGHVCTVIIGATTTSTIVAFSQNPATEILHFLNVAQVPLSVRSSSPQS